MSKMIEITPEKMKEMEARGIKTGKLIEQLRTKKAGVTINKETCDCDADTCVCRLLDDSDE